MENSKVDTSINRGSRKEEKIDDFSSVLERMKKSLKQSHSRTFHKEDTDQTLLEDMSEIHERTFDMKVS